MMEVIHQTIHQTMKQVLPHDFINTIYFHFEIQKENI